MEAGALKTELNIHKMAVVEDSMAIQRAFRALLQAMSHPGRTYPLFSESPSNIGPSCEAGLMLVLRTLLDHEVRFSVADARAESLEKAIARLTGSRRATVADADFVIVPGGKSEGAILCARRGTLEYPDAGATVIYAVKSLEGGGGAAAVLKGPGIRGEIDVAIVGTSPEELADIKEMTSDYPLGIDCVFVDEAGLVLCIPRSTRIEAK
jgi:alpha-D-ribose 1-methylphosphonate 5-triphosphate synthase subunit PhnH